MVLMYGIYRVLLSLGIDTTLVIILLILWLFAFSALFFNIVFFTKGEICQIFPLRPFNRKFIYKTTEIKKITYKFHVAHNQECIILYLRSNDIRRIRIDSGHYKWSKELFELLENEKIKITFINYSGKEFSFKDIYYPKK